MSVSTALAPTGLLVKILRVRRPRGLWKSSRIQHFFLFAMLKNLNLKWRRFCAIEPTVDVHLVQINDALALNVINQCVLVHDGNP